ncbi:hypothetical protein TNCV_1223751 [Trichonephila clavipes]|nr:hypothetical protein TNCV_1223751 [Trichonephila clavipes]
MPQQCSRCAGEAGAVVCYVFESKGTGFCPPYERIISLVTLVEQREAQPTDLLWRHLLAKSNQKLVRFTLRSNVVRLPCRNSSNQQQQLTHSP